MAKGVLMSDEKKFLISWLRYHASSSPYFYQITVPEKQIAHSCICRFPFKGRVQNSILILSEIKRIIINIYTISELINIYSKSDGR